MLVNSWIQALISQEFYLVVYSTSLHIWVYISAVCISCRPVLNEHLHVGQTNSKGLAMSSIVLRLSVNII